MQNLEFHDIYSQYQAFLSASNTYYYLHNKRY